MPTALMSLRDSLASGRTLAGMIFRWWLGELAWFVHPVLLKLGYMQKSVALVMQPTGELRRLDEALADDAPDTTAPPGEHLDCSGRHAIVLLPPEVILPLTIRLPRAALTDLHAATRYRLLDESPLAIDQIRFDVRLATSADARAGSDQLTAEIVLCRRSTLDALAQRLKQTGCSSCTIGFSPMNHLPLTHVLHASKSAGKGMAGHTNRLLALSALAICLGTAPATVLTAHWQTQKIQAEIHSIRAQEQGRMMQYERHARVRAALEDISQYAAGPRLGPVLDDIADHLPTSAWLNQLRYDGQTLALQGYAQSPTGALGSLRNARSITHVKLDTVVGSTGGAGGTAAQFELSARIVPGARQ